MPVKQHCLCGIAIPHRLPAPAAASPHCSLSTHATCCTIQQPAPCYTLPHPQVAGTRGGVTALQLDTKLPGLPLPLLIDALAPAAAARAQIISCLEAALAAHEVMALPGMHSKL